MFKYFIHSEDDENWVGGIMTNNLQKDFIEKYRITFDEEFEDDDLLGIDPIISNVEIGNPNSDVNIYIYKIDTNTQRQQLIGQFNFFEKCEGDVQEFITDYSREIEMNVDESLTIKRFKDYDKEI